MLCALGARSPGMYQSIMYIDKSFYINVISKFINDTYSSLNFPRDIINIIFPIQV